MKLQNNQSIENVLFPGFAIAGFVFFILLYGYKNDFSIYEHWDEGSKVNQITQGIWNFYHPQMLLTATRLVALLIGENADNHSLVVYGRWCSAAFASGSVILFAILARHLYGPAAGYLTGIILGSSALLFGLAHYMKEDTALLFGMAAFYLSSATFIEKPSWQRAIWLGIGCGLASAGKYVGLVTFVAGLAIVVWALWDSRRDRTFSILALLFASILVFAAANFPALENIGAFEHGLFTEIIHVTSSHEALISPIWDPVLLNDMLYFCGPLAVVGLIFAVWSLIKSTKVPRFISFISIFIFFFWVMLQTSAVEVTRYGLPLIATIQFLGVCALFQIPNTRFLKIFASVVAIVSLLWNAFLLQDAVASARTSSRAKVADWLTKTIPSNALIAVDALLDFNSSDPASYKIPQRVISINNLESLNDLRKKGARYVLLTDIYYPRFFNPFLSMDDNESDIKVTNEKRRFYRDVLGSKKILEISGDGTRSIYLSPRIMVFDIQDSTHISTAQHD
jgi:uncharacterized membrane protein YqjE